MFNEKALLAAIQRNDWKEETTASAYRYPGKNFELQEPEEHLKLTNKNENSKQDDSVGRAFASQWCESDIWVWSLEHT